MGGLVFDGTVGEDPVELTILLARVAKRVGWSFEEPAAFRITEALQLSARLLAGPAPDPAPGAIQIWQDSSSGRLEIDTSDLDAETLEQLRALGYVR